MFQDRRDFEAGGKILEMSFLFNWRKFFSFRYIEVGKNSRLRLTKGPKISRIEVDIFVSSLSI